MAARLGVEWGRGGDGVAGCAGGVGLGRRQRGLEERWGRAAAGVVGAGQLLPLAVVAAGGLAAVVAAAVATVIGADAVAVVAGLVGVVLAGPVLGIVPDVDVDAGAEDVVDDGRDDMQVAAAVVAGDGLAISTQAPARRRAPVRTPPPALSLALYLAPLVDPLPYPPLHPPPYPSLLRPLPLAGPPLSCRLWACAHRASAEGSFRLKGDRACERNQDETKSVKRGDR